MVVIKVYIYMSRTTCVKNNGGNFREGISLGNVYKLVANFIFIELAFYFKQNGEIYQDVIFN